MNEQHANPCQASPILSRSTSTWMWMWLCVLFTCGVQIYLLWSWPYAPLVDLPHHMARHYLEYRDLTSGDLPSFYRIEYRILPNLGGDLIGTSLLFLLEPIPACKVYLTLCVLLYWLGPILFILQQGKDRPSAFAAALLFLPWTFNGPFFWGFLNYYSGLGLAFLVLTHFIWSHKQQRIPWGALVLHSFLVTLVFVWHLAPWGIYGVIMGCYLLANGWEVIRTEGKIRETLRRTLLFILPCLPSLILLGWVLAQPRENALAGDFLWGGWIRKLIMFPSLFSAYSPWIDGLVVLLYLAALVTLFRFPSRETRPEGRERSWVQHRGWILLSLAVLFLAYLVLPYKLGSTSSTDLRILPAMLICTLAGLASLPPRRLAFGAVLLLLVLLLRFGSIGYTWDGLCNRLDGQARIFPLMSPRSRVLPVVLAAHDKMHPEYNFLGWAVVQREVFVPFLLAIEGQQPLRLQPKCERLVLGDPVDLDGERIGHCYDYVWVYNPQGKEVNKPTTWECVYTGESVTLWRVR